ncbi:hypothetical protein JW887_06540 [Candidatus Dojkabacteria bacterium]|nr:hypothetical protein [Candidatus Dojkabacteria bacterium]
MLTKEIQVFTQKIKSGKFEFYTRFQEEKWGCKYLGMGQFLHWSRNVFEKRYAQKILNEKQLCDILVRYDADKLFHGLKAI